VRGIGHTVLPADVLNLQPGLCLVENTDNPGLRGSCFFI
jgi:hypothetical protein